MLRIILSKIVINKKHYFHNLDLISKQTGGKEKIAVVLKDNAYGHGLKEIASLAQEYGIRKAVVRTLKEAQEVKNYFSYILILAESTFDTYSHTFHIVINSLEDIQKVPINSNVHLKIDTGMHRNGICIKDIEVAIYRLLDKKLHLTGVLSHHKKADTLSTDFFYQQEVFKNVKKEIKNLCEKLSINLPSFHLCNSSALFRSKSFDDDFARVGIASYGYLENDAVFDNPNLKPVLSLWANKLSTRYIKKNYSVGYGGEYLAQKDMYISTYDIGYGDGFLRIGKKYNYYTPKMYKILGRISMDSLSINSQDDEVCIFEDVKRLANIHKTISYEILSNLSSLLSKEIKS